MVISTSTPTSTLISTSTDNVLSRTKKAFEKLYAKEEKYEKSPNDELYSVIHSIYEAFDFIIFDKSHMVKLDKTIHIHDCTRIKLVFPSNVNLMLIFNGHTAHNGAASLEIDNVGSLQFMDSLRLFSYLDKNVNLVEVKEGISTRRSAGYISNQASEGRVDYENTRECYGCDKCSKFAVENNRKNWSYFGTNGFGHSIINLLECYDAAVKKRKKMMINMKRTKAYLESSPEKKKRKIENVENGVLLIAGDIEKNGWAVYEGVDLRSDRYLQLSYDLSETLTGNGNKKLWKPFGNDHVSTGTGKRNRYELNDKERKEPMIRQAFDDIQSLIRKIKTFENSTLKKEKCMILRNIGRMPEQIIHRDQIYETNQKK